MADDLSERRVEPVERVSRISRIKGLLAWRRISLLYSRLRKSESGEGYAAGATDPGNANAEIDPVARAIPVNPPPSEDPKGDVVGKVINTKA